MGSVRPCVVVLGDGVGPRQMKVYTSKLAGGLGWEVSTVSANAPLRLDVLRERKREGRDAGCTRFYVVTTLGPAEARRRMGLAGTADGQGEVLRRKWPPVLKTGWLTKCLSAGAYESPVEADYVFESQVGRGGQTPNDTPHGTPAKRPRPEGTPADEAAGASPEGRAADDIGHDDDEESEEADRIPRRPVLNMHLAQPLYEVAELYDTLGDDDQERERMGWNKSASFRHAAVELNLLDYKIESAEQVDALKVKGCGPSLRAALKELLARDGRLERLDTLRQDHPQLPHLRELMKVHGIGPRQAMELYSKGARTVEDLRRDPLKSTLNATQRLMSSERLFDDLQTKMPRSEVEAIHSRVQTAVRDLAPGCRCVLAGSYRRGSERCGDVDVLVTSKSPQDDHKLSGLATRVVGERLEKDGFCTDSLAGGSGHAVEDSWNGIVRLPDGCEGAEPGPDGKSRHRRLDIKCYRHDLFVFALFHWTGNANLHRYMRDKAHKEYGFSLSEHGLKPWGKKPASTLPEVVTEADIFRAVGMEPRRPIDCSV